MSPVGLENWKQQEIEALLQLQKDMENFKLEEVIPKPKDTVELLVGQIEDLEKNIVLEADALNIKVKELTDEISSHTKPIEMNIKKIKGWKPNDSEVDIRIFQDMIRNFREDLTQKNKENLRGYQDFRAKMIEIDAMQSALGNLRLIRELREKISEKENSIFKLGEKISEKENSIFSLEETVKRLNLELEEFKNRKKKLELEEYKNRKEEEN